MRIPPWRLLLDHIRPHRKLLVAGGSLGLVGTLTALAQPLVAKWVMDAISAGRPLWGPVVVLTGLVVLGALVAGYGAFILERAAATVVRNARDGLITRILRLRIDVLHRPGDLISRVTSDTTLLSSAATQAVVDPLNGLLMLVGGISLMAVLDPVLLGISGGVVALVLSLAVLTMPRISRSKEQVQRSVGEIGAILERVLGAFRTVKASGAEGGETAKLRAVTRQAWMNDIDTARWTSAARVTSGLAVQIAFLAVLGAGGTRVVSGDLPVSSLVAFLLYLFNMSQPISMLVQGATEMQLGLAALHRMREVEELPVEADTDDPASAATELRRRPVGATFRDVSFAYGAEPVLHDVTLNVRATGITAIVGESGAGKTTLFSLMERFYEPSAGVITIGGRDIREWPIAELRQQIGYVEQDAPVLAGTLRENLCYAVPGVSEDELRRVLVKTRLTDFVTGLSDGLDTQVGHRGSALSGGQRQRIAIARALLRRPRILLMDEASSQLDAANELALRQTVAEAARTTTVMLIAHRLSTVVEADHIILLERGRVRAQGTHNELLDGDSVYRELARGQLLAGQATGRP